MSDVSADQKPVRQLNSIRCRQSRLAALAGAALIALVSGAAAEEAVADPVPKSDSEKFCANIGDAAGDARFAWEARTLKDLKAELEAATAALEAKRAELEEWTLRREEFQKLVEQSVVDIYARMRPEAAAAQLGALDGRTAAAVLMKLNSRTASAILAEMETPQAVTLAELISGGGEPEPQDIGRQ